MQTQVTEDHFLRSMHTQKTQQPLMASVRAANVIGGGDWGKDRLVAVWSYNDMLEKTLIWYREFFEPSRVLSQELLVVYANDARE